MMYHFSLHRARTPKECGMCGGTIPARAPPDYAEYWRVKGGRRGDRAPRVICCLCHAIYGLPTDGWDASPDGVDTVTTLHPNGRT